MNIMELGAIGELVGGLAVVVTLAYLAMQVRQNTKSNRYLATQNLIAGHSEVNNLIAAHGDLAALVQKGMTDGRNELTPDQQLRFSSFFYSAYSMFDFAYNQYITGQLEEHVWKRLDFEIPLFLSLPGTPAWWAQDKPRFSAEFVQYVDRRLAAFVPPATIPTVGDREGPR